MAGPSTDVRAWRLRRLCAGLPVVPSTDLSSTAEVALRVLQDMTMTVEQQAVLFGGRLRELLKAPLPYDSSNPSKPCLMPELMPRVGDRAVLDATSKLASSAFSASAQATTPVVLVTGVSGVGKTRLAYDVGMEGSFVVIARTVERDLPTPPFMSFRVFVGAVCETAGCSPAARAASKVELPLEERISLTQAMRLLLCAHLEWALDLTEAALDPESPCAAALATAIAAKAGRHGDDAHDCVLRELVLRAQRNGMAHAQVNRRFCAAMRAVLAEEGVLAPDGQLNLHVDRVNRHQRELINRARAVWTGPTRSNTLRIVWAHDEAQALPDLDAGLPRDLFHWLPPRSSGIAAGAAARAAAAVAAAAQATSLDGRGHLYGLLAAIRDIISEVQCAHLLLGNSRDFPQKTFQRHSPAQGVAKHVIAEGCLRPADIREQLGVYLQSAALARVSDELLEQLSGRALFVSQLWPFLVNLGARAPAVEPADAIAARMLTLTAQSAVEDAEGRVDGLWDRYRPFADAGGAAAGAHAPTELVRRTFHHIIMRADEEMPLNGGFQDELMFAIERGVLNVRPDAAALPLRREHVTATAFRNVGLRRLRAGTDGVMPLLASRVTGPTGGAGADYGPALEDCVAWALVRACLLRKHTDPPLTLVELLQPYMPMAECMLDISDRCIHPALLPVEWSNLVVRLECGRGCDAAVWESRCPLSLLAEHPRSLLHRPRDSMGGPDIMFLAEHATTGAETLLLLQLKNKKSGTLLDCLPSLDFGMWYTDNAAGETAAHAELRGILTAHPQWLQPVRAIVQAKSYADALLVETAWLNAHELAASPVLLLQATRASLGCDILRTDVEAQRMGKPKDHWPACLLPTAVRHGGPAPAAPVRLPARIRPATLRVEVSTRAGTLEALSAAVSGPAGETTFTTPLRLRARLRGHATIVVCKRAGHAFSLVRRASANRLQTADGTPIQAVFVP